MIVLPSAFTNPTFAPLGVIVLEAEASRYPTSIPSTVFVEVADVTPSLEIPVAELIVV